MVRSVQVEHGVQQFADGLVQGRAAAQIGLLLGREAAGRDYVLHLARCPDLDGRPPVTVHQGDAKKAAGPKKPAASLALDKDWVIEHAMQVDRLLPGGLRILGAYLLCPEAALASSSSQAAGLLHSLQRELPGSSGALLLLHIDAATGKLGAKEAQPQGLAPCDLRATDVLASMVTVQCRYALSLQLHETDGSRRVADTARRAVREHAARSVRPALCLLDGRLHAADAQLGDALGAGASYCVAELLVPTAGAASSALHTKEGGGVRAQEGGFDPSAAVALRGVLDCRALVHRRETVGAAQDALKADIERSLLDRLEVLREAVDVQQTAEQERQERQQGGDSAAPPPPLLRRVGAGGALALPRRAFVAAGGTGGAGGLLYCDYLLEGEGSQAMLERLHELVGLPRDGAGVECLEQATRPGAAGQAVAGADYGAAASRLRANMACWVLAGTAGGAALVCAALAHLAMRER